MNREEEKNRERKKLPSLREKSAVQARFFVDLYRKFGEDRGLLLAAGIAFSLFMCVIPVLLLIMALAGSYLVDRQELLRHILRYGGNLFPALDPQITQNLARIIQDRQIVGILGIGGLVWTSTWVFSNLRSALNIVFRTKRRRGLFRGKVLDLAMILLTATLLLLSIAITTLLNFVTAYFLRFPLNLGPVFQFILQFLVPFIFTFAMFFLIYKILPNRTISSRVAFWAAIITGLLWEAAKLLFSWYVLHLGRFSMIYGSLGALIIFSLWVYYSSVVFLLGGEIASLLEEKSDAGG